jgi:hypothetical protein
MNPTDRLNRAPRCRALSKRSQLPCRAPAVRGKRVCRCHGANAGAPKGERNGRYRTGLHTVDAKAERKAIAGLIKEAQTVTLRQL